MIDKNNFMQISGKSENQDSRFIEIEPSSYTEKINNLLKPKINQNLPCVVDLFAGCGGLSLGFEAQGFPTLGYEIN